MLCGDAALPQSHCYNEGLKPTENGASYACGGGRRSFTRGAIWRQFVPYGISVKYYGTQTVYLDIFSTAVFCNILSSQKYKTGSIVWLNIQFKNKVSPTSLVWRWIKSCPFC